MSNNKNITIGGVLTGVGLGVIIFNNSIQSIQLITDKTYLIPLLGVSIVSGLLLTISGIIE